jgi:hypothetical protein
MAYLFELGIRFRKLFALESVVAELCDSFVEFAECPLVGTNSCGLLQLRN